MAPLLEAKQVHTYYDRSHILHGISMHIQSGEIVGLMGRNGMGKTTLVRTLMGLVAPRAGSVLIDGLNATGEAPYRVSRRGIAYVPEGRGIFASLTVRENLLIAGRRSDTGPSDWTLASVLELFPRLSQRLANRGDQLSGGEQQMLAIGRALLTNPRLLILDEATEGLAPIVRDEIWRTIALIRDTGLAALIVDKSVSALSRIADRVLVLVKGTLVFDGPPGGLASDQEFMKRNLGV